MNHIAACSTSFVNDHPTRSTASPVMAHGAMARAAFGRLAFAGAALVCLLMSRPGLASESIGSRAFETGSSSLRVQANSGEGIRVPTAAFTVASADLDGFRHQASSVRSESRGQGPFETRRQDVVANAQESSTIVEPATIAVLGFTVAALLAVRRKKNAAAAAGAALSE